MPVSCYFMGVDGSRNQSGKGTCPSNRGWCGADRMHNGSVKCLELEVGSLARVVRGSERKKGMLHADSSRN